MIFERGILREKYWALLKRGIPEYLSTLFYPPASQWLDLTRFYPRFLEHDRGRKSLT